MFCCNIFQVKFFNQDFQIEFPFLFTLFGGRKEIAYFSKRLQLKRVVSSKVEYLTLIIEKVNEKVLFNSTHFLNTNLGLIFSEFIFISLEPPTTLSRRLYINLLQKALGIELQRFCVNFLHIVKKVKKFPKLFWLDSNCNLLTCLGLKKTSSFATPLE